MTTEEKTKASKVDDTSRRSPTSASPMIFISHDGRDAALAEAFSKLLSSVSAGVLKSFRSSDRKGTQGFEYGVEWYPELMSKLDSASDVVCLLTSRSLDRPWILYEAGVAKGKLDTSVYGIALGIPLSKANAGPFAQFQNSDDSEEALTKLVMQLLQRIPDSEPDQDAVQMQVTSFKKKADDILKELKGPQNRDETNLPSNSSAVPKLFEEIKVMFQDLSSRVEGQLLKGDTSARRSRLKRMSLTMLEEIVLSMPRESKDPIGLLLIAGFIHDHSPWLSEVITETYRQVRDGDTTAVPRLQHFLGMFRNGRFMTAFSTEPEYTRLIMVDLPIMIDHYMRQFEPSRKTEINLFENTNDEKADT